MNATIRNVLITLGWAFTTSTIALSAVYLGLLKPLTIIDMLLFFLVSVFAGLLLVDAGAVMTGFIALLALNAVMVYFFLTLPFTLSVIQYAPLREMLTSTITEVAFGIVLRIVILNLMVPAFLGVVLGGIIGERLGI